jgi:hypothetical protein
MSVDFRKPDAVSLSIIPPLFMVQYGVGLGCLTPLSTIFQLYRGDQFDWWEFNFNLCIILDDSFRYIKNNI